MTSLRDAESATAGVPVAWLYPFGGKMAVTMDRQVACDAFSGVASPIPLVPASELDTARAEIERLRHDANKYAYERDKACEERDAAERRSEGFWKPQLTAAQARIAELEDGVKNAKGFLDNPLSRRRHAGDQFYTDVVASLRALSPVKENDRG